MSRSRYYISIVLMSLAIIAVTGFQGFWLHKNYKDEKRNLDIRSSMLFREAVFQCQAEQMKMDSNMRVEISTRHDAVGVMNAMKARVSESDTFMVARKLPPGMVISLSKDEVRGGKGKTPSDSVKTNVRYYNGPGEVSWVSILRGVDSLQDSIRVIVVKEKFNKMLKREKMKVDYAISRKEGAPRDEFIPSIMEERNEVSVGFAKPVTFRMDLQNTNNYILAKLWPQILVSVLLVGLTVFSFILLLRNLIRQQKLTQLKNEFISNITHELKTPIATVSVAIEALKNFNALQDPARTKEYLDISGNELQRLSLLVDKVLKLSMFEKHQIEIKKEMFDLHQLAEEVSGSMRLQFEKYHAHVTIQTEGKDFSIKADRLHLTSVLFNLLDNALKYSRANPSVQIGLKSTDDAIELSVTDNGIGITPEHKKRIFEKFYRVPSGDTHNVKGYGLGLSYVAYVVKLHDGSIDLESQLGIGSRFVVTLPKV